MRAIDADELKKKAFGKRGGLIHTADIDAMPTIGPERQSGREVYQAGYAEGYKAGRARMLCDIPVSPLLEKQKGDPTGKRLIDANNLIEYVWRERLDTRERIAHLVESMPTIEEHKTGTWERHYSRPNVYADMCWHCSNCGYKTPDNWANKWKFCPHCGARMVQEGEDNGKTD